MDLSEQVKSYQDAVRIVVPLLKEKAQQVGESFKNTLSTYLESDQKLENGSTLLLVIAKAIETFQANLEASDLVHAREIGDDAEPRAKRDEAHQNLYREITTLREEIGAVYGNLGIKALGMEGATPSDPPRLERFARDISGRLADTDVSLGDGKKSRVRFDRQDASSDILPLCDNLKHWLNIVDKEAAEAKTTQEDKTKALREWQEKVPKLCSLAKGIFLVAGDFEGASKITATPPRYRRTSKAKEIVEETSETPENTIET